MDAKTYPPDWKQISSRIRFERAQSRCECVGECGRGHVGRCHLRNGDPSLSNPNYAITLTVAHLDAVDGPCQCKLQTGLKCGIEEHLKAMCNACHLSYDMPHHIAHARRTRASRAGQLWLGDIEGEYS